MGHNLNDWRNTMKKESLSVMFACALGAFIGALSAIEISACFEYGSYFWGVGAIFGGLVAYCAVDFQNFCAGVARSYRVSAGNVADAYRKVAAWRPYLPYWKATSIMMLGNGTLATSLVLFLFAGNYYVERFTDFYTVSLPGFVLSIIAIITGIVAFFMGIFTILAPYINSRSNWRENRRGKTYEEFLLDDLPDNWDSIKFGNPVVLPFVLLGLLALGLYGIGKYLWENKTRIMNAGIELACFLGFLGKEIWRFFVRTFVYVHSERRTICFVDAALGAMAGFYFGSAIIGMVVGAVLGFVNYEFVSIRWLKLVPAKAK